MKQFFLLIVSLMLSIIAAGAAEQPVSEIDLLVGQTMKFYPAGTHLTGYSIQDGSDFVQVSRSGARLDVKGLKAGDDQSKLNRFYRGLETVCGRECWVFDFRGKNFYGYGGFCVWVEPETGLVLRHESEEGGGFVVTRFDLDYHAWDIQIRPDLFEKGKVK